MLHKLRIAMVRPNQDHLSGEIEVDEVFLFNRRTSNSRGLLFYRLLENAVAKDPSPYAPKKMT